jgi:CubicO group peptidase (beta-lactamase class C family)
MILLSLALACGSASQQPEAPRALTRTDVERFADSAFADYLRLSPEPSLAFVVVKDGAILLARGYGFVDAASKRPVDPDSTVFWMASLSKLITTEAILHEVVRGRLTLEAPVSRYLDWELPSRNGWPPVTLGHLLTHTSGLDEPFMQGTMDSPDQLQSLGAYLASVRWRAGMRPGEVLRYSNHGMALAGGVLERLSGTTFAEYVDREIFRPLGMNSSTFQQPASPEIARRIATAGTDHRVDYLLPAPAGAMVGTALDLGRFLIAELDSTSPWRQSHEDMHATHWRAHRQVPGIALGWFETRLGGVNALYHTGARHHFSVAWILPSHRTGVFLVHSMRQGGRFQGLRTEVIQAFVQRYFTPDSGPAGATSTAEVGGVYRPLILGTSTVERAGYMMLDTPARVQNDGRLSMTVPGGLGRLVAEPIGEGLFEVRVGSQAGLRIGLVPGEGTPRIALGGTLLDPVVFTRLRWWERGKLHLAMLILGCAALGLVSLVRGARWAFRRRSATPPSAAVAWRIATGAGSALLVALGAFLITVVTTPEAGASEHLRRGLGVVRTVLSFAAVLGLALPIATFAAGRQSGTTRTARFLLTLLSLAGVGVALLLWEYRLIGFSV